MDATHFVYNKNCKVCRKERLFYLPCLFHFSHQLFCSGSVCSRPCFEKFRCWPFISSLTAFVHQQKISGPFSTFFLIICFYFILFSILQILFTQANKKTDTSKIRFANGKCSAEPGEMLAEFRIYVLVQRCRQQWKCYVFYCTLTFTAYSNSQNHGDTQSNRHGYIIIATLLKICYLCPEYLRFS